MRAALVVNRITADLDANLAQVVRLASEAAAAGAELVLLPEAAVTGLANDEDPTHDLPLGQETPGAVTGALAEVARTHHVWLATGILERVAGSLYDTAVLLGPDGEIALIYRRIQPQWHGRHADPAVYHQGTELASANTPLGTLAFMICGDLFDDALVARTRALHPDWLLIPLARCFGDGDPAHYQERWDRDELPTYAERVRLVASTALLANYVAERSLNGGAFGGAWVFAGDGSIVASYPLGRPGKLLVDLGP